MVNFENGVTAINDTNLNKMQVDLLKAVFPIGSTYITQENTNPNTILGFGTWERLKGKVCLGLDENDEDFNEIGKTGGEKTHTLTVNEMPSHNHPATGTNNLYLMNNPTNKYAYSGVEGTVSEGIAWGSATASQGEGQPHNNMQPYEVVGYMWIRRA